jgi:cysteine-S-conjugate beta-lyase
MKTRSKKQSTLLAHAGRDPARQHGIVNPGVWHASTVIYPTVAELEGSAAKRYHGLTYGRHGTPTTFAFEEAVAALEGGWRAIALPSGLAAVTAALLGCVKVGDHVLMADHVYGPARAFATTFLKRMGVETTFYDPMIGAGIGDLIRDNTSVVYMESPGSLTFEVQDVPAIVAAAKARGVATLLDNTWASPLFYQPLKFGVDASIVAATKYIVGHSDAMLGVVACTEESWKRIRPVVGELGFSAAPDDVYLGLRGLRTAMVRMRQHEKQALALAQWLEKRKEVRRVLHPALPSHPGHEFWKRDFTGASGLFGVVLEEAPKKAVDAMLDGMELFGMGYSWGGFESLILPTHPEKLRSATTWAPGGPTLRLHAGLEDLDDLIADLEAGLGRLNAAR